MRFNRNTLFDDMKEKISEEIYRRCGRRISKLFYKFPVSTNPIKFTEMELIDDKDMETMVTLYCGTWSNQNKPIQLFVKLAGVEPTEDPTPLGEEDGAQELCMVVLISYVDSQSTIHGIDIDLNPAPETNVVGNDVYHNRDLSDHEVYSDSGPDVDEVLDNIDNEDMNEDGNVNVSSVKNQIRRIVIHNNPGAHMSRINPDTEHAAEFSEYPEILPAHQMAICSDLEELFVGQRFKNMSTIKVSVLITEMQARFQCRVSYRKILLLTISQDRNKIVLPIAFAIVDKENMESCEFFLTNLQMLATLTLRMGQQQVNQMEARHVFVENVKDAMVVNLRMARLMNVEVYSQCNETFRVTETIGRRPNIPPRSYGVDLQNRLCDCRRF
ncbi:hypothetical protein J1N35_022988 [Gossypium stocksii]|uniref:MULE transposase domain-containing protein n=1 Tax=Gossypium stocksii TaxID=47602 RepID=A0A9D4A398_9ROSI|nr:hypothetical protein J1N35_022988 [Gossypium stocksii]